MKKNIGSRDKIIRLTLAVVLIGLYLLKALPGSLGLILLIAAFLFLMTSLINFCPLYAILGIKTCKTKKP